MKNENRSQIAAIILLSLIFIIPLAYFVFHYREPNYLDNLMGNYLATIIGVGAGVPIGLAISNWQQEIIRKNDLLIAIDEEKKRKKRILELLKTELTFNHDILDKNKKPSGNGQERVIFFGSFKDELWRVFSDGGEIEWVKDNELLAIISDAYYRIRILKYYEALSLQNRYFPSAVHGVSTDTKKEIVEILFDQDNKASTDIEYAIVKINSSLLELK